MVSVDRILFFRRRQWVADGLLPILLLFSASRGRAQVKEKVILPPNLRQQTALKMQNASMSAMLEALRQNAHVSLLADGEPLREKADIDTSGTVAQLLDRIADTFDYEWKPAKSGIVLLTKRFQNEKERPQINLPEMQQMAKDMVAALRLAPLAAPDVELHDLWRQMMRSLTPEQLAAMSGETPFSARDLSPPQRQLLQQGIWQREMPEDLKRWDELARKLSGMTTSYFTADLSNISTISYTDETGPHTEQQAVISHVVREKNGHRLVTQIYKPAISRSNGGKP